MQEIEVQNITPVHQHHDQKRLEIELALIFGLLFLVIILGDRV